MAPRFSVETNKLTWITCATSCNHRYTHWNILRYQIWHNRYSHKIQLDYTDIRIISNRIITIHCTCSTTRHFARCSYQHAHQRHLHCHLRILSLSFFHSLLFFTYYSPLPPLYFLYVARRLVKSIYSIPRCAPQSCSWLNTSLSHPIPSPPFSQYHLLHYC